MIKRLALAGAVVLGFAYAGPAYAIKGTVVDAFITAQTGLGNKFFDLRKGIYEGACEGAVSCTVSDPNAEGRKITIEVVTGTNLFHGGDDGFGIRTPGRGDEEDEVDSAEVLRMTIEGGWNLVGWAYTDLYVGHPFKGPDRITETARLTGFTGTPGSSTTVFTIDTDGNLTGGNGERAVDGQDFIIDFLEFSVPGGDTEEFSVAALAGVAVPAPEPSTLALFGTGLLGLGFLARRRRKTNA